METTYTLDKLIIKAVEVNGFASRKEMCQYLNINESYLSQMLSGRRNINSDVALKIKECAECPRIKSVAEKVDVSLVVKDLSTLHKESEFMSAFFRMLKYHPHHPEAYEQLEVCFSSHYRKRRYASYDSFRKARSRYLKSGR